MIKLIAFVSVVLFNCGVFAKENLKIVTYNVGLGFSLNLENKLFFKILTRNNSIKKLFTQNKYLKDFDILSMQELCSANKKHIDYFHDLGKIKFGNYYFVNYAKNPNPSSKDKCQEGQAILSRYPILDHGIIYLPKVGSIRSAIWADIELPSKEIIRLYNIHLSNRDGKKLTPIEGRWQQMQVVLAHYNSWRESHPNAKVFLMGDLNSMHKIVTPYIQEKTIKKMHELFSSAIKRFKMTFSLPFQLDWIFFDKRAVLKRAKVVKAWGLSDHFPIMAEFSNFH